MTLRLLLAAVLLAGTAVAQPADTLQARYQAFDATGEALPLDALLDAAAQADVVFVGEIHDDPTGHAVELAVLAGLHERAGTRPVVLALEMFEADVQLVID
ncbi:MAG TPA: ChaN family lipoprotein, partial [Rubricoccaceae bacterium]